MISTLESNTSVFSEAKFKVKYISFSILMILSVIAVSGYFWVSSEKSLLLKQINVHGESLTKAAAFYCKDPLLAKDIHLLADYARNLVMERNDVVSIQIVNAHGTELAHARSTKHTHEVYTRQFHRDVKISPLHTDIIGRVYIGVSTKYYDRLADQRFFELAVLGFVLIIAFIVSNVLVSRRSLTIPVNPLESRIDALLDGDFITPIEVETGSQHAQLAKKLDLVRQKIGRAYDDIHSREVQQQDDEIAKEQFLANMVHEFRNPLVAVIGYSELLLEEVEENGHTTYVNDLEKILRSGKSLLVLVKDILELSLICSTRSEIQEIEIDLLIKEAFTATEFFINNNKTVSHIDFASSPIWGDEKRLRQILTLLLSNAGKFTRNGTITVYASRWSLQDQTWLEMTVSDTGIGIEEQKRDIVFQPFYQAATSGNEERAGVGLGLTIAKRLCEHMGGRIEVASELGSGSAFKIVVPVKLTQS